MAEAQDSLDVSELKDHFLECSVCLEHFDQAERCPRLLVNCLHSFCSQCLEQLLKKEGRGQVTCPNCRQVQKVKGNAQSLPIDPVRNKLVDYVKFKKGKQIPCTDCPDGSHAVARCHECQIYMCAPCKEAHHRNRSTRKHTCQSLKEALSEPVKYFLSHRCEDHPDYKIEFFCRQCSSLCCVSCPIVKHKGHDLDPIEDAANSMLSSLKTKMEEVEKSASVLRRKKTSLKEKSIVQKVDLKHTTTSINKTFDELIGKFNCQRNKLITELKERTESTVNSLEKQLEATEDSLAQMESTLEYFKQMESKSDDCEVLSAGPVLVKSLEAAAAVDQTQDVQHPTWTFSPGEMNNVISMVQRTGEIHSDTKYQKVVNDKLKEADKDLKCKSSPIPKETPQHSKKDDPMTEHDKYYPDRFLVSGLSDKNKEETLSDFVEVCSAYEVDKIEYSLDMSKAVVTLKLDMEQKLDTEDWSRLKSGIVKRPLEGSRIVFKRLPVSNKICVWHFHRDHPNLPLRDYFEHPTSGNKSNSAVDVKTQDEFSIVTFDNFSVQDCVLSHKPHTLSGHNLVVTAFYDDLGPVKQAAPQTREETFRFLSKGEGMLMSRLVDSLKSAYNLQEVTTKGLEVKLKGDHFAVASAIEKLFSNQCEIKQREVKCSNLKSEYLNSNAGRKEMIAILDQKGILASWICHPASITIHAFSNRDVSITVSTIENDLKEGDLVAGRHFDALKDHLEHNFDKGKYLLCRKNNLWFLAHKDIFSDVKSEIDSFLRQKKPKETLHVSLSAEEYRFFQIVMPMSRIRDDLRRRYDVEIQDSGTGLSVYGHEKNVRQACDDLKSQIKRDELSLDSKESERFQKVGNHGLLFKHIEDTKNCVVKMEQKTVTVTGEDEDLGAVGGSYGSKTESYGSRKRLYGSDKGSRGSDGYFYKKEKADTGDNGWKHVKTIQANRRGPTKKSRVETQFVFHLYSDTYSRLEDGKVTLKAYAGDRELMEFVNLPKNVTERELSRSLSVHDVKVTFLNPEVKGKPADVLKVLAVLKTLITYKNDFGDVDGFTEPAQTDQTY